MSRFEDKILAVDFDGTLCEAAWHEIGKPIEKNIEYVKEKKKEGWKLILWTNRVEDKLEEAIAWCGENDIYFDAINENLPEVIEAFGNDTRKIYATIYLDDRALNAIKQIPGKPIHGEKWNEILEENEEIWRCPVCQHIVGVGNKTDMSNYCEECGQKIRSV